MSSQDKDKPADKPAPPKPIDKPASRPVAEAPRGSGAAPPPPAALPSRPDVGKAPGGPGIAPRPVATGPAIPVPTNPLGQPAPVTHPGDSRDAIHAAPGVRPGKDVKKFGVKIGIEPHRVMVATDEDQAVQGYCELLGIRSSLEKAIVTDLGEVTDEDEVIDAPVA